MNRTIVLVLTILLGAAWSSGQQSRVIVLHSADSLVGHDINGKAARELIGNVVVSQENVWISCDRAIEYRDEGLLELKGNLVVREGAMTLTAPRGLYYRDERRAEAFDNVALNDGRVYLTSRYGQYLAEPKVGFFRTEVTIVDSASKVTSDSLRYFRDTRRSIAMGHVCILDTVNHVTITGGRLDHNAQTQFSRMTLDPELVQVDSGAGGRLDTLVVRSLAMEAYRDSVKRFVAIDSVRMSRGDLAGRAGFALFYTQGDSMVLRRSPVVWYQDTQVSGDSIDVYLKQRVLHDVHVMGNAFAISLSDSLRPERQDQMTGETMRLQFEQRTLHRIDVEIHAISLYHVNEDSAANGLNKTSGDRIIMSFEGGKVQSIRIIGGVEGQYVPENLVRKHEAEYRIPGYAWRGDRPRLVPRTPDRKAGKGTL